MGKPKKKKKVSKPPRTLWVPWEPINGICGAWDCKDDTDYDKEYVEDRGGCILKYVLASAKPGVRRKKRAR